MQGTVRYSEEFIKPDGCKAWFSHEKQYDQDTQDPPFEEVVRTVTNEVKKRSDNYSVMGSSRPLIDERGNFQPMPIEEEIVIGTKPEDILSSPDLVVLESYRWIIKGKSELERAYILRHDQLTQKQ